MFIQMLTLLTLAISAIPQPLPQSTAFQQTTCQNHCIIKFNNCHQSDAQCITNFGSCNTGCTVGRDFFSASEFPNVSNPDGPQTIDRPLTIGGSVPASSGTPPPTSPAAVASTPPATLSSSSFLETCKNHCIIKFNNCHQANAQCITNFGSCNTGCTVGRDFFSASEFPNVINPNGPQTIQRAL